MRPAWKSAALAAPPASLTSPKSIATTKRQRKAAPLGDVTNLFVHADTPTTTPSKPRRRTSARHRCSLPARSDVSAVSSACSSSASVTLPPASATATQPVPNPKPSSSSAAAAFVTLTPARRTPSAAAAASATPAPARKPSSSVSFVTPARKLPPAAAAFVTPASKPSSGSAAVLEEERGVLKSPAIDTVYRRTTEAQGRWRRNPAASNSKGGKEPVAATARCPPLGKSARTQSRKKDTRPISASAPCYEGKKKRSITSTPNLLEGLLEKQRAYFADIDAFELVEEEVSESELE